MRRILAWIGGGTLVLGALILLLAARSASICNEANLYAWSFKKCVSDKSAFCALTPEAVVQYNYASERLADYGCPIWDSPHVAFPDDDE